jgi:photosystem II stability/assembly factor-like uncharacterized protein
MNLKRVLILLSTAGLLITGSVFIFSESTGEEGEDKLAQIAGMWEQEWARTHDPELGSIPRERLLSAKDYSRQLLSGNRSGVAEINWIEHGPVNVAGRTRALLFDKNDPLGREVWAAGVSGGLWHTENIFDTIPDWQAVDDFFDNIAITTLAQDPIHPDTLYFGTGEGWFNGDALRGLGIWKSTDGGQQWNQLPSTKDSSFFHVQKLLIDAYGNLLAATRHSGVMRSQDGGLSWQQVLGAGAGEGPHDRAADLELGADGSIYASLGILNEGRIYRSDHGQHAALTGSPGTWHVITPPGSYQRMEIACAPSDPNRLYVMGQSGTTYEVSGIFSSSDAGQNWTSLPIPNLGKQAWYDLIAAVHPDDPNEVYVGGIHSYRSLNAGQSWQKMEMGHVDHHTIQFSHQNNQIALWGTDGGLYLCQDIEASFPLFEGRNWGYLITQFYSCAIHPGGNRPEFLGGTQDNGTHFFEKAGMNDTDQVSGGDGGYCHIDQLDPEIQISALVRNQYRVTTDAWASKTSVSFSFSQGWFINPTDYDSATKTLYCANGNGEYRRWSGVNTCKNSTCSELVEVAAFGSGKVTHISVAPQTANRIYVGLNNGRIVQVEDAHTGTQKTGQWLNQNAGMPQAYLSCIAVHPEDEDHLLVAYSNYGIVSLWESEDGGQNWGPVEGNLPDMPVRWVLFAPESSQSVILGTELGVWATDSLAGSNTFWMPASDGLANTRVDMLQWRPSDNNLLAATHGRGMFSTDYYERLKVAFGREDEAINEKELQEDSTLCSMNAQRLLLPVGLSKSPADTLRVQVEADAAFSAVPGRDFLFSDTILTFVPGGVDSIWVPLYLLNDAVTEDSAVVGLILSVLPANFPVELGKDSLIIQMADDDPKPTSMDISVQGVVGEGTLSQPNVPFRGNYSDLRAQMLYKKDDLLAAGIRRGFMDALGFEVLEAKSGQLYEGFTIKLKNTNDNIAPNPFDSDGVTVFSADVAVAEGVQRFELDMPFFWDGSSNLLVDICFNNSTDTSNSDVVAATNTDYISLRYRRENFGDGCLFTTSGNNAYDLPNLYLWNRRGTDIETLAGKGSVIRLWPDSSNHVYQEDYRILASITPFGQPSTACSGAYVHTAGNQIEQPAWLFGDGYTAKTFYFPDIAALQGGVIDLYFTDDELAAWGNEKLDLNVLLSDVPVSELPNGNYIITGGQSVSADTFGYEGAIRYRVNIPAGLPYLALTNSAPVVLPSEPFRLEVSQLAEDAHLRWYAAFPTEPERYLIFRSQENTDWQEIGQLAGNASLHFIDRPFFAGELYYRIGAIFPSGDRKYSNIEAVSFSSADFGRISILPNPADTRFSVSWNHSVNGYQVMNIYDSSGKLFLDRKLGPKEKSIQIDCSGWSPGCYFVVFSHRGQQQRTERLIIY